MNRVITFVVFLLLGYSSFGQGTTTISAQNFEQRGMKLISDSQLSDLEIAKLLSFNFEPFREQNESVIIKVVNGPNIELFSSSRFKTGKANPVDVKPVKQNNLSGEDQSKHEDIRANEREIKILQVRIVDVFKTDQVPN